jgi:hypothetical protein
MYALYSHRRTSTRLQCQISTFAGYFTQDRSALPAPLPLSSPPQTRRTGALRDVARAAGPSMAAHGRPARIRSVAPAPVRAARADARMGTADFRLCRPRGAGAELARPRSQVVKSDHGRPAFTRPCRLFGHLHEGMHAH